MYANFVRVRRGRVRIEISSWRDEKRVRINRRRRSIRIRERSFRKTGSVAGIGPPSKLMMMRGKLRNLGRKRSAVA